MLPRFTQAQWQLALLSFAAGALFSFALAPYAIWPLAIISTGFFFYLQQQQKPLIYSWFYGIGQFSFGVYWVYTSIHTYGGTHFIPAIILTAIFSSFLGGFYWLFAFINQKLKLHQYSWLTFPALWVLLDWSRTWLMGGFPWLYIGYGFIDTPFENFAPIGGIFLVSFSILITISGLIAALHHRTAIPATLSIVILASAYSLNDIKWTTSNTSKPITVSLIQGNIPQDMKWLVSMREETINIYKELTETEWGSDLVVWPESAIPMFFHEAEKSLRETQKKSRDSNTALITGAPFVDITTRPVTFYNSIFTMGNASGYYYKQKLVPFGEFIPLENFLRGAIPFLDMPMSSFTAGDDTQDNLMVKGYRFAPFICYEVMYPDFVRKHGGDSDVLVTISNDAWFGTTSGPHQHLEMVRMRALETGRYIVRATNTGLTVIISPNGKIINSTPQFERNVLRGTVYPTIGSTPFIDFGSTPIIFLCFAFLLLSLVLQRLNK